MSAAAIPAACNRTGDLIATNHCSSAAIPASPESSPKISLAKRANWLGSGQRLVPPSLAAEPSKKIRDYLWHQLPEALAPHYTRLTRNEFFKQGVFARFSGPLLKAVGLADGIAESGYVCLLPEQEHVAGHQRQRHAVFFLEG